mmetsp:Transcript_36652/g.60706  ORF Transcript_36652/g.60706 Transcript_36652/m.60706 type:complete len:97 (-) Transcript_36652:311-601(-)
MLGSSFVGLVVSAVTLPAVTEMWGSGERELFVGLQLAPVAVFRPADDPATELLQQLVNGSQLHWPVPEPNTHSLALVRHAKAQLGRMSTKCTAKWS